MFGVRTFVDSGGLVSYATDFAAGFHKGGVYVGQILKGAKPGELPVLLPTKFELVINLKTAKTLGLTVPANLIARADEVIEWSADVCYWPIADIPSCTAHVRL
jgi:putative tryptophan/tyrosine transport system substrate-binding protein